MNRSSQPTHTPPRKIPWIDSPCAERHGFLVNLVPIAAGAPLPASCCAPELAFAAWPWNICLDHSPPSNGANHGMRSTSFLTQGGTSRPPSNLLKPKPGRQMVPKFPSLDMDVLMKTILTTPTFAKNMPQTYAMQRGSVWHRSPLNLRDFYRKYGMRTRTYGMRTPPFMSYERFY